MIHDDVSGFAAALPGIGALMGLDLGTKTIGVALSDGLRGVATPVETVKRKKFTTDAARLTQIIAERDEVQDYLSLWSEAEREFHELLISACGSPLLRETYGSIYLQFRQQMVGMERDFGSSYFNAIIAEHQAILDAALSRDAAACRQAIYDHLKRNL